MLSSTQKTFVFASVMCVVCSILLTAAAVGLKPLQEKNKRIDQQKNILKALQFLNPDQSYKPEEIESLYGQSIQEMYLDDSGNLVKESTNKPVYVVGEGTIEKYAVPFKAYGLWSWIYGYIAISGDGNTVIGFTVYSHAETPGLGAECEKEWFQKQFVGKSLTDVNGRFVSVGVTKGKVKDSMLKPEQYVNYVDGMSGATITSKGIQNYLKEDLAMYEPLSKSLRSQ